MSYFDENIRRSNLFYGYKILTEGVFVVELATNVGILSFTNCVGNDKRTVFPKMQVQPKNSGCE